MKNSQVMNAARQPFAGRRPAVHTDHAMPMQGHQLPEILVLTSFPPRACGIATYSQDLIAALNAQYSDSFKIKVCALETTHETHHYTAEVGYVLDTDQPQSYISLAARINANQAIKLVLVQHEFGLFHGCPEDFEQFLRAIYQPVLVVFHTVLPQPAARMQQRVQAIADAAAGIIVMTAMSASLLESDYGIAANKISVIAHGTHLVRHQDKQALKRKYQLEGREVLSTFGLLSAGKGIELTLEALPAIVAQHPEVMFLIIGKTHPSVVLHEGERYRDLLCSMIDALKLGRNVQFVDRFLPLNELLEYLQLTDIYLFTSTDPHQAVSGTFSYAISSGCPIISTPIPHAREILGNGVGRMIDFGNAGQLATEVITLLDDADLRASLSSHGLHKMAPTAWENAAIAHAKLFQSVCPAGLSLRYRRPPIVLDHLKRMTTSLGMVQFCMLDMPDIFSGFTLDDNARAMITMCQHYALTLDADDLQAIGTYLRFIAHCQHDNGYFLNYVAEDGSFTDQNNGTNLADANGRAIWALGYLVSLGEILPLAMVDQAQVLIDSALPRLEKMHSTRAMAFAIKGLYYRNTYHSSFRNHALVTELANRLLQMYKHEAEDGWDWFESYLTYANSVLPEAMLCAFLVTGDLQYRETARTSFDFLLSKTFLNGALHVVGNKTWLQRGATMPTHGQVTMGGEQPIDVAYTILALSKFDEVFHEAHYRNMLEASFDWFLGRNHLNRVIYNPSTGGCYDGLEHDHVNLNQGAESTLSYLMARLTVAQMAESQPARRTGGRYRLRTPLLSSRPTKISHRTTDAL